MKSLCGAENEIFRVAAGAAVVLRTILLHTTFADSSYFFFLVHHHSTSCLTPSRTQNGYHYHPRLQGQPLPSSYDLLCSSWMDMHSRKWFE